VFEQAGVGDRLVSKGIGIGRPTTSRRGAREVFEHERRDTGVAAIGHPFEVEPVIVAQRIDIERVTDTYSAPSR